jgi:ribosomal protein S18 acetylase RimI-like enzyme
MVSIFVAKVNTSASMEGVIDPPSSLQRLTVAELGGAEVWRIGLPLLACVTLSPRPGALYLGKLAVAAQARGQGQARALVAVAAARARALGLPALELQTRVELTANQAIFRHLGFAEVARTAHPGYDRPTSITYRRSLD